MDDPIDSNILIVVVLDGIHRVFFPVLPGDKGWFLQDILVVGELALCHLSLEVI